MVNFLPHASNTPACQSVVRHVDAGKWDDALLTLNGDAVSGREYPDVDANYQEVKKYFLTRAAGAGVDLGALYAEYAKPE